MFPWTNLCYSRTKVCVKFKGLSYYVGAIATTKCIKAILFVFLPGKTGDKV